MPARPVCRIFIPMMRHGQLLCARCGVHIDFHPAEVNRQQPINGGGGQANRMNHLGWHAERMGIRINRQPPPPPPPNPGMDQMNNNNQNNNNIYNPNPNNNHWPNNHQLPLPAEAEEDGYVVDGEEDDDDVAVTELNSNTFTREQLRRMLAMARSLGWSLRGRSRDANINQFCQEIGITRLQFSNWLRRNSARFARRHRR